MLFAFACILFCFCVFVLFCFLFRIVLFLLCLVSFFSVLFVGYPAALLDCAAVVFVAAGRVVASVARAAGSFVAGVVHLDFCHDAVMLLTMLMLVSAKAGRPDVAILLLILTLMLFLRQHNIL